MNKINYVSVFFISKLLLLVLTTASFSQEFDWNDNFVNGRKVKSNGLNNDLNNSLPGVRKNPFQREQNKFCNQTSLGEALDGSIPNPRKCPRKSLTIFEIELDPVLNSSK